MGIFRQEYWSGLPFPSPGDLPHPGTEPVSPMSPEIAGGSFTTGASLEAQLVKNPPANAGNVGDVGLIPGLGRSPGEGNGSPLQYSCLKNPVDGGAWRNTVRGVTES